MLELTPVEHYHLLRMPSDAKLVTVTLSEKSFESGIFWIPGRNWVLGRKFEAELRPLVSSLEREDSLYAAKSVDVKRSYGAGFAGPRTPEFLWLSKDVVIDLAKVSIPALFTFLLGWLARSGRGIRLKIGDIELEAENERQLKELIPLVKELKDAGAVHKAEEKSAQG